MVRHNAIPQEARFNARAKTARTPKHTCNTNLNLDQALFGEAKEEYHVKVVETIEEATNLIAVGYEYVSTMNKKQIYRKRK